jgi:hypothetical protein
MSKTSQGKLSAGFTLALKPGRDRRRKHWEAEQERRRRESQDAPPQKHKGKK